MCAISQKDRSAFFGLENAFLPFDAQRGFIDVAMSRREANDALGTMRIELVRDQHPFAFRVLGQQLFHMPDKIIFRSCIAHGRCDQLAGGHLKVRDQALRPVTHILELSALHQSQFHRQGRMKTFQRLNARHFVDAYDMNADLMQNGGVLVRPAKGAHLACKNFRVFRTGV